jgi:hypothetical protein
MSTGGAAAVASSLKVTRDGSEVGVGSDDDVGAGELLGVIVAVAFGVAEGVDAARGTSRGPQATAATSSRAATRDVTCLSLRRSARIVVL